MFCLSDSDRFPFIESGTFRLSDIDREDSSASLSINWSELTLIVHGMSSSETQFLQKYIFYRVNLCWNRCEHWN